MDGDISGYPVEPHAAASSQPAMTPAAPSAQARAASGRAESERLNRALIDLAVRGERPRCSDPVDHQRWTSNDQYDRAIASAWCAGCPIRLECLAAATARNEKWHVWGGRDFTRRPTTGPIRGGLP